MTPPGDVVVLRSPSPIPQWRVQYRPKPSPPAPHAVRPGAPPPPVTWEAMATEHSVQFTSGSPETVLEPLSPDLADALAGALALPVAERRAAVSSVAARDPRCLQAWATLAELADAPIDRYAFARVGYHRGLDALRAAGWRDRGMSGGATSPIGDSYGPPCARAGGGDHRGGRRGAALRPFPASARSRMEHTRSVVRGANWTTVEASTPATITPTTPAGQRPGPGTYGRATA